MGKYENLLAPLRIGEIVLANRIVMPPMVTYLAEKDGLATSAHVEHYRRSSGPGLVVVEGTAVAPEGRISARQLGIYDDCHIEGLSRLAQVIHKNGAIAGIQIHHAGALAFREGWMTGPLRSFMKYWLLSKQQLMMSKFRYIQNVFESAAERAVRAGFEIIELHAAHGYLFSQFLSRSTNWRMDRYGCHIEDRRRFLLDVYQGVRSKVAEGALIICRLGVADRCSRGLALSDGIATASELEKKGARLLDISSGWGVPRGIQTEGSPFSGMLHLAKAVRSAVSIPVIGGGGLYHPDLAEKAIRDGFVDLVAVGRGLLADPSWVRKTVEGRPKSIAVCRKCKPCYHHTNSQRCPARKKTIQPKQA